MLWGLFPSVMLVVIVYFMYIVFHTKKEEWRYQNWDFDDFPSMCRSKMRRDNEEMLLANTPHFGGTPNNSQVWM